MCRLVNGKTDPYEKALLTLLLISYIQPFVDGNKRTSRLMANAVLIAHGCCPLSFRTVAADDYRAALLLFYEQNNGCSAKSGTCIAVCGMELLRETA